MTRQAFLASTIEVATTRGVEIVYTDGVQKELKRYNVPQITDDAIVAIVRAELASFAAADAKPATLTFKVGDEIIPPAPSVASAPTLADQAQSAFLSDWRLYRQLKALGDAGVTSSFLEPIANVQARLQKNWLDSYLVMI